MCLHYESKCDVKSDKVCDLIIISISTDNLLIISNGVLKAMFDSSMAVNRFRRPSGKAL